MQIVDILQVINSWCCQDLHELTQGKPLIQQHDMVAAQTSSGVCQRRFLLNQMNCFIAAEMTPVLQLVDLYIAKKGKDILEDHKQEIRRMLREECRRENKAVTYKASPLTLMLLMNKIHEGLQDELQKQDWILHHMRQAGHLAYRPSVDRKLLIPTHEYSNQKWLKSHPLAGGGKIEVHWRHPRHEWRDEESNCKKAKWEEQDQAAQEALECRERRNQQYLNQDSILVTAEEQDIFDENSGVLQMHPAQRYKKYTQWAKAGLLLLML